MPETMLLPTIKQAAPLQSVDVEARTVEVVFTTGETILHEMWTEQGWRKVPTRVEVTPEAAILDRLNAGAPVLNDHSRWGAESVIGHVQRAWIEARDTLHPVLGSSIPSYGEKANGS